jgi:hypothetical protein
MLPHRQKRIWIRCCTQADIQGFPVTICEESDMASLLSVNIRLATADVSHNMDALCRPHASKPVPNRSLFDTLESYLCK